MKWLSIKWQKLLVVGLLVIIYGCVAAQESRQQESKPPAAATQTTTRSATANQSAAPASKVGIYEQEIKPLTTYQCAQCHYPVYSDIRDNGGRHKIDCTECHETFHTWKPGKKWSEVVPKCVTCHDLAHGTAFPKCLTCHADPHAPVHSLVKLDVLAKGCNQCHPDQKQELTKFKSAHTEVACSECHHTRHGYLPKCTECHDTPHTPYTDNKGCQACHPVHSPLEINYPKTTRNQVCAGCHEVVTRKLIDSHRKHSKLQCVFCHADRHGYVPQCTKCHSQPHSKAMLDRFKHDCKACHGEPHALILPGHK